MVLEARIRLLKGADEGSKGASKNIRIELAAKKDDPDRLGNSSTISLANTGILLQDFETVSSQAGLEGFDLGIPFELLTGVLPDNSSSVTLPGDEQLGES